MAVIVVMAEERSAVAANAPTAAQITAAFERARLPGPERDRGRWLGPSPRVVRHTTYEVRGFTTFATWVYVWPTDAPAGGWALGAPEVGTLAQELVDNVARELRGVSMGWQPVQGADYAAAVNGDLQWWLMGDAAVTQTRDTFPHLGGYLDDPENPRGPTTPQTHPTNPGDALGGALRSAGNTLVNGALVLGGVYLLVKLLDD